VRDIWLWAEGPAVFLAVLLALAGLAVLGWRIVLRLERRGR
jgi:hypothetical protein